MRYCFIFIAFVSLLCSCKGTQPVDDADVLVKVKDRTLRRSEIKQQIPRGLSSADSMLLAESLERKWVKDALVYDVALRNLEGEDKAEVDKLVEEYRHSLKHRMKLLGITPVSGTVDKRKAFFRVSGKRHAELLRRKPEKICLGQGFGERSLPEDPGGCSRPR